MSPDENKFKLRNPGVLVKDTGIDVSVERALQALGFHTVPQLYAAMKASPDVFADLLKDFGITYEDLLDLLEPHITPEDRKRLAESPPPMPVQGLRLDSPEEELPDVITRKDED